MSSETQNNGYTGVEEVDVSPHYYRCKDVDNTSNVLYYIMFTNRLTDRVSLTSYVSPTKIITRSNVRFIGIVNSLYN